MYVPFVSSPKLFRRKGGGRGGGRPSSGGGSSSSAGGSRGRSSPISLGSSRRSSTTYGRGGGRSSTISSGQLFAGRQAGGGTRAQVFGNRAYGSGYPGIAGRGVTGRSFPFFFWPVVWGSSAGSVYYLRQGDEYGTPTNTSRPGGAMQDALFTSRTQNTTFHVLSDNSTIVELITAVGNNCSSSLSGSSYHAFNDTDPRSPKPESAIQYYRASSVVLTLDGYNNSAALRDDASVPDTPLPTNIDLTLLTCLNETIGAAVPLIDGARLHGPSIGLLGFFWIIWLLFSWM